MRLGIVMIPAALAGVPVIDRALAIARQAESLDFSGVWVTDAFGRGRPTLDPLTLLGAIAAVTNRVELGTCVVQVPLRHPVEHAHRVETLHLISGGRLRFGVGSGSTKADFDAIGADFETRFKTLTDSLATMRATWRGEGPITPWPASDGGPPVLLGAWRSRRWIDLAAHELQGWIGSGIYSTPEDLEVGLKMYRAAGGKRAVLANIFFDFRTEPRPTTVGARSKISLYCPPAEARERLKRLADLGLDDALLVCPFDAPEQLEQARALWPT